MWDSERLEGAGGYFGAALAAAVIGASAAFLFDPQSGARRRALMRDQIHRVSRQSLRFAEKVQRDAAHRVQGLYEEATHRHAREGDDAAIIARVRSTLGRLTSHPRPIEVICANGAVTLRGDILSSDVNRVLRGVARVRGVTQVNNELLVHEDAERVPDLQGGGARPARRFEFLQQNWSPAPRVLAAAAGASLTWIGVAQRNGVGYALSGLGAALLLRSVANMPLSHLFGVRTSDDDGVLVHKSIEVYAETEEVYGRWRQLERLPEFLSHIRSIEKLDDRRYRWRVDGPGGAPVEWEAEITAEVPNELIAWRTAPGSLVHSSGVVQFEPTVYGGTRMHVRMTYRPPANAIGHTVAKLFARDPKRQMDEDLLRFKTFVETGAFSRQARDAANAAATRH